MAKASNNLQHYHSNWIVHICTISLKATIRDNLAIYIFSLAFQKDNFEELFQSIQ